MAYPFCFNRFNNLEQSFNFVRSQNPGRFIQDQNLRIRKQQFENFNFLLLTNRKLRNQVIRIYFQSILAGKGQDSFSQF